MNLRRWLAKIFLKKDYQRLQQLTEHSINDWRMVPYFQGRQNIQLLDMLGEVDPQLVSYLLNNLKYTEIGTSPEATNTYRMQVVQESRSLYLTDPLVQFSIELWTDYAFGSAPNITAQDGSAQAIWDEFFLSDRNAPIFSERELHTLSETQLQDGELFFAIFASTVDGLSTIRTIPTDQIKEIIYDPEDSTVPLFYRRDYSKGYANSDTLYYPDWHATEEQLAKAILPEGAKRADKVKLGGLDGAGTDVVMLHAAFRKVRGRGWPLVTASIDWSREYRGFLKDRAAVTKAANTWVEKIKAKGGQRAVDAIRNRIGTSLSTSSDTMERNPPPVAGSTWIENEALSREWMNRPTNASDAEKDGMALLTQAGLGMKLYPHFLGHGDYYKLATATAMEGPTLKSFNRYQAFWSSIWQDMFKIVLDFIQQYGTSAPADQTIKISTDRILSLSTDAIKASADTLTGFTEKGLIDPVLANKLAVAIMQTSIEAMGIQGVDELFEVTAEEAELIHSFFAEDAASNFDTAIHRDFYALWSGKADRTWFIDDMEFNLDKGLRAAWKEGMKEAGLDYEDITDEENAVLSQEILDQMSYVSGVADYIIENSKTMGGKLSAIQPRAQLWINRFKQLKSRALLMVSTNPLLIWKEGPTIEKCADCRYADGRIYRASIWKKWGWETQSEKLECQGFECQCSLTAAPVGSKANKGHPRRPKGK
jgi:hypothetical protein